VLSHKSLSASGQLDDPPGRAISPTAGIHGIESQDRRKVKRGCTADAEHVNSPVGKAASNGYQVIHDAAVPRGFRRAKQIGYKPRAIAP
jgi:hypothetical protein